MLRRAGVAGVRAVSTLLRVAPPSWSGARSATAGLAAKACTSSALASVSARGFASSVVYPPACATIGQLAPSFTSDAVLPSGEISKLSLSDLKGQWVVLLFYPKDFTFVCPTELIAFSDAAAQFTALNATVVAVSTDTCESHAAWIRLPRKKGGLGSMQIPMLADVTKTVSAEYGTLLTSAGIALRGLFIIDPAGVLQQITINNLPVGRSVDEALRLVKAFQFVAEHGEVCPAGWTPGAATMKANAQDSLAYFETVDEPDFSANIPSLTSEKELHAAVAKGPVVVDFYASWCGKCRQLAPHVDSLMAAHPGVKFYKVDTDALPDIAKKYDAKVLPTFLMWKNGSEVARVQGYKKALLSEAVASLAK